MSKLHSWVTATIVRRHPLSDAERGRRAKAKRRGLWVKKDNGFKQFVKQLMRGKAANNGKK